MRFQIWPSHYPARGHAPCFGFTAPGGNCETNSPGRRSSSHYVGTCAATQRWRDTAQVSFRTNHPDRAAIRVSWWRWMDGEAPGEGIGRMDYREDWEREAAGDGGGECGGSGRPDAWFPRRCRCPWKAFRFIICV